jgi:hypothetical protein
VKSTKSLKNLNKAKNAGKADISEAKAERNNRHRFFYNNPLPNVILIQGSFSSHCFTQLVPPVGAGIEVLVEYYIQLTHNLLILNSFFIFYTRTKIAEMLSLPAGA